MKLYSGNARLGTNIAALIIIGGAVGWCMNLYKLIALWSWPPTGLEVGRVLGVFIAPIGAVLGYV